MAVTDGLLAYYEFEGSPLDWLGGGRDLAAQVSPTPAYAAGRSGLALSQGDLRRQPLETLQSAGPVSAGFWLDALGTASVQTVTVLTQPLQVLYITNASGAGSLQVKKGIGILRAGTPGEVTTGWHHVLYTYDGANWVLYLDGAQLGTGAVVATGFDTGLFQVRVARAGDALLDGVAVWSRALSAGEAATIAGGANLVPGRRGRRSRIRGR